MNEGKRENQLPTTTYDDVTSRVFCMQPLHAGNSKSIDAAVFWCARARLLVLYPHVTAPLGPLSSFSYSYATYSMTSRSCTRKRDERRCVGSLDEGVREISEMLRSQNGKVPDTRHFFSPLASFSFPLSPSCLLPLLIPSLFIFLNYFSFSLCLFTNTHKLGRIHDIIAQSCDANERTTIERQLVPVLLATLIAVG